MSDRTETDTRRAPIPIHVIAGPLGVGKTTTINHLLQQRPDGQRWAVLVNEYGLIGLDAALISDESNSRSSGGVEVREVAGGCICCSAGLIFKLSLVRLLRSRPDRLLIEPTGLAALSGILDTLEEPGIREAVDVRSILCILDPRTLAEALEREEVQDQVEAADVLLAGRADLADAPTLKAFHDWAGALFPPKLFIGEIENGQVDSGVLDLVSERQERVAGSGYSHGTSHDHSHDHAELPAGDLENGKDSSGSQETCDAEEPIQRKVHLSPTESSVGWICWREMTFDAQLIASWLGGLAQSPSVLRAKGVLQTAQGWLAFNVVEGAEEVRTSSYRRDSRLEILFASEKNVDVEALDFQFRSCLTSPLD